MTDKIQYEGLESSVQASLDKADSAFVGTVLTYIRNFGSTSGDLPATSPDGGDLYICEEDNYTSSVTGDTYDISDQAIWSDELSDYYSLYPSSASQLTHSNANETITGQWSMTNPNNSFYGDGSNLTGLVGGGPSEGTNSVIRTNATTIDENITIPVNTNGTTAGPITISAGYTVTVSSGSTWTVL